MKILLVAVNASYMHTNIAIRYLKNYAQKFLPKEINSLHKIQIVEFTINQPYVEVLRGIESFKPDLVLFSAYIWNASFISNIIPDVKKILPNSILGAGGPEFSYSSQKYLTLLPSLDFIINGEGEITFTQILKTFSCSQDFFADKKNNSKLLSQIKGLSFSKSSKIIFTGFRPMIENLDDLPFTYPEILEGNFDPNHKIYYYESNRGCPFSCSYCLSSVDKSVRFKSLGKVKSELKIFLDANVKLVKFVDRTFNLNSERYIKIWQYILENHNHKTMFHFEIEAEYLNTEALNFLQKVPKGIMQFEIGIQSSNKKTLQAINRSQNVEIAAKNISKIPKTIHQHLDLIAGLPFEDLKSFGKSFDFVAKLKPDALQLGFLKVLPGTQMEKFAKQNNWQWMQNPVYETFSTPYVSFEEMMYLKDVETLTDFFWNKHIFDFSAKYIFRKVSPWAFITSFTNFARSKNAFSQARKDSYWFELYSNFIDDFIGGDFNFTGDFIDGGFSNQKVQIPQSEKSENLKSLDKNLLRDLLRYDFILTGKKGNFPTWYKHFYSKENHIKLLEEKSLLHNNRLAFATTEYEEFDFDVRDEFPENHKGKIAILIQYPQKI